jgi:3-methyladenine DNA glycosylase AlkC
VLVGLRADPASARALLAAARRLAGDGITRRVRGIGSALAEVGAARPELLAACAAHPSDVVRSWAAYAHGLLPARSFAARLARLRPFAADRSMATRECAWDAWRPEFRRQVGTGLRALARWVNDPDPNLRRCAIEGSRPRGVWTEHVPELKAEPWRAEPLLAAVRADPSRYVQTAVANWLNDASKSQPDWVVALARSWRRGRPSPATGWILHHALRTLRRHGAL